MANYDRQLQFNNACRRGHLEEVKQLVQNHQLDFNMNNGFARVCFNGHIDIAKWLVHDHQVDVHTKNEDAFRCACQYGQRI